MKYAEVASLVCFNPKFIGIKKMFSKLELEIHDRTKYGRSKDLLQKPCICTQTPEVGSIHRVGLPGCLCPQTLVAEVGIRVGGASTC